MLESFISPDSSVQVSSVAKVLLKQLKDKMAFKIMLSLMESALCKGFYYMNGTAFNSFQHQKNIQMLVMKLVIHIFLCSVFLCVSAAGTLMSQVFILIETKRLVCSFQVKCLKHFFFFFYNILQYTSLIFATFNYILFIMIM